MPRNKEDLVVFAFPLCGLAFPTTFKMPFSYDKESEYRGVIAHPYGEKEAGLFLIWCPKQGQIS